MKLFQILAIVTALALPMNVSAEEKTLIMATTTSTDNSGLLDFLKPDFEKETGITLKWVAVGTGKALEIAKNCDADVLLVHAPAAEKKFVEAGHAIDRREIMHNDFVLVGPKNDPAGVKGKMIAPALKQIAEAKAVFVSRGDNSGTHKTEQKLWKASGLEEPGQVKWYISAGQGMLATLRMAAEKNGYALTDRGTWIKYLAREKDSPLAILVEGDKALFNQYSVMRVNPAQCPKAKDDLGKQFEDWWVKKETQDRIAAYKLEGKQLFFPDALK